jgi:hypothetical protein
VAQPLLCFLLIHLWLATPARAQILQADWTKEADQQIEKHRKVPVRVIVLDREGKPVANAAVRLEQKRHAFAWGAVYPARGPRHQSGEEFVPSFEGQSAVSWDEWTRWTIATPAAIPPAPPGLWQRFGVVLSADPGRLPESALDLRGDALRKLLDDRVTHACSQSRYHQFDIYADSIDHDFVGERLGPAMIRRMFELAKAASPGASTCARFGDAFEGNRAIRAARKVTELRDGFVPVDAIAIDARFRGTVVQTMVKRQLDSLAGLQMPITVARLEVGGESEAAAAINLETVLRTLFAEPMVQGIYMVGFSAEEVADPNARLTDDRGKPTDAGRLLNKLAHEHWWTDEFAKSDHLGNAKARVFAGTYKLTAALPGERSPAEITVYLPAGESERIVVLQPLALPAEPELDLRPKPRAP